MRLKRRDPNPAEARGTKAPQLKPAQSYPARLGNLADRAGGHSSSRGDRNSPGLRRAVQPKPGRHERSLSKLARVPSAGRLAIQPRSSNWPGNKGFGGRRKSGLRGCRRRLPARLAPWLRKRRSRASVLRLSWLCGTLTAARLPATRFGMGIPIENAAMSHGLFVFFCKWPPKLSGAPRTFVANYDIKRSVTNVTSCADSAAANFVQ